MKYKVAAYGLTEEQVSHLAAALPEEYEVIAADCVTDLIVADSVCSIINGDALDLRTTQILVSFFLDAGDCLSERVIWLGDDPLPDTLKRRFLCYTSISDLLLELKGIVTQAQIHCDHQQLYKAEFRFLSRRAIEDTMEEEIENALRCRFGDRPSKELRDRLRQEWAGILEVDGAPELAAVYELTRWLKGHDYPFWCGNPTTSSFIPYLLGITSVNPLPPDMAEDGHNLVWREFCGGGLSPRYVFHLSKRLMPEIAAYLEGHWLERFIGGDWLAGQSNQRDFIAHGNMNFNFDIDEQATAIPELPKLCREDVYFYLKKHGFTDKDAFRGMNRVRKGRGFPVITEEMQTAEDNWILDNCENVKWLPSKGNILSEQIFWKRQSEK